MSLESTGRSLRVVVLGGCGFIGRNLIEYLIVNDLVSVLRVVDKVPPEIAWLNRKHAEIFKNPKVDYRSANLINPVSCKNALAPDDDMIWDLVVNCAGETKIIQDDSIYKEGILTLSLNCIKECARLRVHRYVEISSGCMYSTDKAPHMESGPVEPWTLISKWKSQVELELEKYSSELKYTIVRPAIVYGIGERRGISSRLLIASIYKHLREMMKLLWNADMKINTVHVLDLCRAIIFLADRKEAIGQIYNVVDKGNTTQGKLTEIISNIFNTNHDYWGTAISTIAKANITSLVDEANDKHLACWSEMCLAAKITNTPLDPTMNPENLLHKHTNLDGSKLDNLGFKYEYETITEDKVKEIIYDYIELGIFPKFSIN